jgi:lipopolysaccharide transport system ATP-binding protein
MSYLHIQNIGKAYKRYPRKWGRMAEWLGMGVHHDLRWVLRDISFDVEPGEAVGIIGINGTGKSTLLKIITGTTRPTTGTVEAGGRISALLELGMGFHPEFTGRQNAYMSAQLHGLTASEVDGKIRGIEEFAEIGDYFDQPVRTYSTGMLVRVAFSVATCVRPDILIVDEALSVGDAAFQRKCFARIEAFRGSGCTLLFVSHSAETVKMLCDQAVLIHENKLKLFSDAKTVCDEYERILFDIHPDTKKSNTITYYDNNLSMTNEKQYGNGKAEILTCWMEDESGKQINVAPLGSMVYWKYRVKFISDVKKVTFGMMLKTKEGVCIFATNTNQLNKEFNFTAGKQLTVSFQLTLNLTPNYYYLNSGMDTNEDSEIVILHRRVDVAMIRILSSQQEAAYGIAYLGGKFDIEMDCKL